MMCGCGDMWATPLPARQCCGWGLLFIIIFFLRICADLASIRAEPGQFGRNWIISAGGWNWPKRPKQAKISLESCRNSRNWLWMRPKHPKSVLPLFYFEYLLLLCFLFCLVFLAFFFLCFVNQGHIMCFLRIF